MKRLVILAAALALAASPALAQNSFKPGQTVTTAATPAVCVTPTTGAVVACATSTSALQTTGNTALGAPADTAVTNPASSGSIIALLKGLITSWASPLVAGSNIIGGVSGAETDGVASARLGSRTMGKSRETNLQRDLRTDDAGGLLPGQVTQAAAPAIVTPAASTATQLLAANSNSVGATVQLNTTLIAPLYICYLGTTTTCSATLWDLKFVNGSQDGTVLTLPATRSAIYGFTTQASVSIMPRMQVGGQ